MRGIRRAASALPSFTMETATQQVPPSAHAPTYARGTLCAIAGVLDSLAEARVAYCAWKSNQHLDAALAGETDLDLLVDRADAASLAEALARHGLKRLLPPADMGHPATEHFLGFDRASGSLFHLHVQYQLVLGQKYIKNYTIPLERQFLESAEPLHGVPVPRAELELAILAARALLKYRPRDVVKDVLRIRSPGVPAETRAEITWLEARTTLDEVRRTLDACGDVLPSGPICAFLARLDAAPRSGFAFLRLRAQLRRELVRFRRRRPTAALLAYLQAGWRRRRHLRIRPTDLRMTPQSGGMTIAFVGADGSGKSTTAETMADWLGWKLQSNVHYMGSKSPTRRSRLLYLSFRVFRRAHRATARRLGQDALPARPMAEARDVLHALHHLSIGRDRACRYQQALAEARAGRVVIFDRFPLACVSKGPDDRLLDGPQIASALGPPPGRLARRLAPSEERLYEQFRLPDHLIVLTVEPDVAVARKPDHDREVLRRKCRAVVGLAARAESRGDVDVARIDANRSAEAVLSDVKVEVWDAL